MARIQGVTAFAPVASVAQTHHYELGDWLGRHRVPARRTKVPVTALRSTDGTGLACAPSLDPSFSDASLENGKSAEAILAALAVFSLPVRVDEAIGRLATEHGIDPELTEGLVAELSQRHFLRRA